MDPAPLIKQARECKYVRAGLLALAEQLPADETALDELLAEAVRLKENEAFTHMLLAALSAERTVDARHLAAGAALLPSPGSLVSAALHLAGNVAQALVEAVIGGAMGKEREALALLLAGVWCHERPGHPVPIELISQARLLARRTPDNFIAQLSLVVLADLLEDDGLSAVLRSAREGMPAEVIREYIPNVINPYRQSVLAEVPEHPQPIVLSGYTVRRAAPRVGRNDPCPCGSGKKYKKCCLGKDQERLQSSSAIPGLTLEELRTRQESFLTKEQLLGMRSYELSRLDPLKVDDSLKPILINRLNLFGQYEAVVQLFEAVGVSPDLEGHWDDTIEQVARARKKDLMQRLLNLREPSEISLEDFTLTPRLLLLEDAANPALDLLEANALSILQEDKDYDLPEVAYGLLESRFPALGILVARGAVLTEPYFEASMLLDAILEARDKLNLPPKDPAQSLVDERFEESMDAHRDSAALQEAHQRVEEKNREVAELNTRLAQLRKEVEDQEKNRENRRPPLATPTVPAPPPPDDPMLRELRERVASLKEQLKERHAERNELRRDLRSALADIQTLREQTAASETASRMETEASEDLLLLEEEKWGVQPVRLPAFPAKFLESRQALPPKVIRHALNLIGRLASGEVAAFAGVKRLKANREVFRQRVGADHRLLFRLLPGTVEILDLINRRDLERRIKTLNAGRSP